MCFYAVAIRFALQRDPVHAEKASSHLAFPNRPDSTLKAKLDRFLLARLRPNGGAMFLTFPRLVTTPK
jgi:hypothetical protein